MGISGTEEIAHEAGYTIAVCLSGDARDWEIVDTGALAPTRVAGMLVSTPVETAHFSQPGTGLVLRASR